MTLSTANNLRDFERASVFAPQLNADPVDKGGTTSGGYSVTNNHQSLYSSGVSDVTHDVTVVSGDITMLQKGRPHLTAAITYDHDTKDVILKIYPDYLAVVCDEDSAEGVQLPQSVEKVYIFPINDDQTQKRARVLKRKLMRMGLGVGIVHPPEGLKNIKDCIADGNSGVEMLKSLVAQSQVEFSSQVYQPTAIKELIGRNVGELEFVIDGLLPAVGLGIVVGDPKVGKSWLVWNVINSISAGAPLFKNDDFRSKRLEVFYLSLEDNLQRIQSRCGMVVDHLRDRNGIILQTALGDGCDDLIDSLTKTLALNPDIKVIIIDPYEKVRPLIQSPSNKKPGAANAYQEDYALMSVLKKFADENELLLLIVHHRKKHTSGEPVRDISGSMGMAGSADVIITLEKNTEGNASHVMKVTGKDVQDQLIKLNSDDWVFSICEEDDGGSSCTIKGRVLDLLSNHPDGMRTQDIMKTLGLSGDSNRVQVTRALTTLVANRLIEKISRGVYAPKGSNIVT